MNKSDKEINYYFGNNIDSNNLLFNYINFKIELFHVFEDDVFIVTVEDNVYGCGKNSFGFLGLGHNNQVNEPTIIPELCQKDINQFIEGELFVVGFSSKIMNYTAGVLMTLAN